VHEAVAQIKGAERSLAQMHELLQAQKVPGLSRPERTQLLREQIDPAEKGRHPETLGGQKATKPAAGRALGDAPVEAFARPLLVAESPHHIGWTTPATAAVFAGQHLQFTVQQDLQISAGETLSTVSAGQVSLFAQQGPLKAVAAKGPLSLQAHTGELELLAGQNLTITATDERVDVLAQERIVLQAGNCRITLDRYDITIEAPGEFVVRAQEHPFLQPSAEKPFLTPLPDPSGRQPAWIALDYRDAEGATPKAGTQYAIHFEGGPVLRGVLDQSGQAHRQPVPELRVTKVIYTPPPAEPEVVWTVLELIAHG